MGMNLQYGFLSIHLLLLYPGLGHGGSNLSREAQPSLYLDSSASSSGSLPGRASLCLFVNSLLCTFLILCHFAFPVFVPLIPVVCLPCPDWFHPCLIKLPLLLYLFPQFHQTSSTAGLEPELNFLLCFLTS